MDEAKTKAEKFLENLLNEGSKVPCDDSSRSFSGHKSLPPFYDEELFKKGQQFYHKNIFAIFSCKFFGLLSVLVIPSILKILMHTKKSGSELTAYRRYLATIFHMTVWYDSDFKPGSKLWQSIEEVKNLHNSASKSSCTAGLHRINQKDMVLTQFGFMGYALVRSKSFGIYHATDEEYESFIHLWRVIGYLMGIEDRFNLCKGSVEETKEICNLMIKNVYRPYFEQKDKDFLRMTFYMVNGLWCISPILNYKITMGYIHNILEKDIELNFKCDYKSLNRNYEELNFIEKVAFGLILVMLYTLRWDFFRIIYNYFMYFELWCMRIFPILAYYRFGIKKAEVKILFKKYN